VKGQGHNWGQVCCGRGIHVDAWASKSYLLVEMCDCEQNDKQTDNDNNTSQPYRFQRGTADVCVLPRALQLYLQCSLDEAGYPVVSRTETIM